MTEIPQNTKEEESQSPAANQCSSDEDEHHEYQLRQLYDVMNPIDGPVDDKLKKFQVVCKECGLVADHIQEGSSLQDCRAAHRHASLHRDVLHKNCVVPHQSQQTKMELDDYVQDSVNNGENSGKAELTYTSTLPIPSSDFSEHQLRQLFKLLPSRGLSDILDNNKEHTKRLSVVCKLCSFVADRIQEGSSLQDSHGAHQHASLHRDLLDEFPTECDEDISMTPIPNYSEAELLRIYLLDSHTWDCGRPTAPPSKGFGVVSYLVVCKVCKEVVYDTPFDLSCLHKNLDLQEHAFLHSEYLCVDGPAVPELDVEDVKKDWVSKWVVGYESGIGEEDVYTPMQEGFVKVCCWCYIEDCSSGDYMASAVPDCDICGDRHDCWNCPKWEYERPTPCNGDKSILAKNARLQLISN